MHDRAVAIPFYMLLEPLMGICPCDLAHLGTLAKPVVKSMKMRYERVSIPMAYEIDEGIAKVYTCSKVNWKVDEIIAAPKSISIEEFHKAAGGVCIRDISHHDCRAIVRIWDRAHQVVSRGGMGGGCILFLCTGWKGTVKLLLFYHACASELRDCSGTKQNRLILVVNNVNEGVLDHVAKAHE